ncbi:MAG: histidine phosphatase family protein [Rhodocyclales bacterium]|nr:histidine phosphatase family protein [Rhodocyclales bacterium]
MGLTVDECVLCLVRHGETAWNAQRRLQGHLDIPLNEIGHVQADATARNLAGHRFAALYSSDLARAQQTAQAIAGLTGLGAVIMEQLRERHYGAFQGLTYDEARTRYPDDYARFKGRDCDSPIPGGGESLQTFNRRISSALEQLTERHRGEQILIVTHGGVLDIAHRRASGMALEAPRDFLIPNAALNWIACSREEWRIVRWAEAHHLDGTRDELAGH